MLRGLALLVMGATMALSLSVAGAGKQEVDPPGAGLPVGPWSVEFANRVTEVCEIRKDGTASVVEPLRTSAGKAAIQDGSFVIDYDDDRVERWTPVGQRMVVEHWYPRAKFPSAAPVLGIAQPASMTWGPVAKGLQMSIHLERTRYRADEPILLDVAIRNTANEEADLGMSVSDLSSFDFAVCYVGGGMTQAGRMPFTKYGAKILKELGAAKNVPIRLKAGEQRGYRFPLNRLVDMSLSGTYSVAVDRYVPGQPRHDREGRPLPPGPKKPDDLASNELFVEITEPPIHSR